MPENHLLLEKLRQRSPQAFEELFDLYSDKIYRLALSILNDEDEAEDVVQETFLKFFEKLDQFEGRSKIGTWLYRTTHNASVDRLRLRKPSFSLNQVNQAEVPEAQLPAIFADWRAIPEEMATSAEIHQQLDAAIAALPETLRAVFILRDVEDLSTAETAEILSISIGAVKVRLHRARLLLRENLAGYFRELV